MSKNVKIQWENKSVGHTDQKIFRKLDDGDETLIATVAPTVREYTDVVDIPATTAIYRAVSGYMFGESVYMEYSEHLTMDLTTPPALDAPMVITTIDGGLTINVTDPFRVVNRTTGVETLSTAGSSLFGKPCQVVVFDEAATAATLEISSINPFEPLGGCILLGTLKTVESWAGAGYRADPVTPNNTPVAILLYAAALTDVPSTLHPSITNMNYMFYNCPNIQSDITVWDVSNVTTMLATFINCPNFNQDISVWDVSKVTNMETMFMGNANFNQNISVWNTAKVTNMNGMFRNATLFNQDLSQWCVPLISALPSNFATNAALTPDHLPVWGTCPRGENQT